MNDKNTPASYPTNPLTQMIEAVAARNAGGMSLPPQRGVVQSAAPQPTVRSADLGHVSEGPPPMSAEERAELDLMALRSGFVTGPVTPGIAAAAENLDTQYGSLEEAIRAGAPVGADDEAIALAARAFREPPPPALPPVRMPVGGRAPQQQIVGRQTAREFIGQPVEQLPRLPDFRKVQMIDLVNGKVYVDALEFNLTKEQLQMLRKFCVTTAKEQIQKSLETALAALDAEDTNGGSAAAV